ncbi:MAG TPA: hypothetical protein VGO47_02200, partial [Chlamydiales bacterium]|nr:hypothetical protein [Chlamydiales bacterium]
RACANIAWDMAGSQELEKRVNERSWLTRSAIKAAGTAAVTGGALLCAGAVTTNPIGLAAAAGAGALIGGRATRINNLKTGHGLPSDPKAPLLETAHKIALFQSGASPAEARPAFIAPLPSVDRTEQIRTTDRNLQAFIQKASIATTITLVHTACLGLPIDPAALPRIIREASQPNANLWNVYMQHLGNQLTTCQWIRACFWFFLSHSLGIIPNSIKTFMTNVLVEGRRNFSDPTQIAHLDKGLRILLDQVSSFLDVYNGATRKYANALDLEGDVDFYRREAIARFSGKSLETLTQEFCTTLVDQFFPHIPFFETLKQYSLIGWAFTILDYLIGGVINCIGRRILKCQLPKIAQSLIETGIDSTNPTNLPFSIAMMNAITQMFRDLEQMPQTIAQDPILKPEKLPAVIEKLLDTLELNGSRKNPLDTQQKIKEQLNHMDNSSWMQSMIREQERDQLRKTMLDGTHVFITYLSQNTEQLFGNVLNLLNSTFVEAIQPTPLDYANAQEGLDLAAQRAFNKLINDSLQGVPIDLQREYYQELYTQYKASTDAMIAQLNVCQQNLIEASTADRRMQGLEEYAAAIKHLTGHPATHKAPLAGSSVTNAFYEAFHPLHKELPGIADQLLNLQALIKEQQRNQTVETHLTEIDSTLGNLAANPEQRFANAIPTTLRQSLSQIDRTATRFTQQQITEIQTRITRIDVLIGALETTKASMKRLQEQKAAKQVERPWLDRVPSLSGIAKGPSPADIDILLHIAEQQHSQNLQQLQTSIGELRAQIRPMIGEQTPLTRSNLLILTNRIDALQRKTMHVTEINRAIQPARVEINPFIAREGYKLAAKITTPYAMKFFKKVLHFITMKDPYDASRRIMMQTFIDAYRR